MNDMLQKLPKVYKAVAAFCALLIPLLTVVQQSFSDGTVTSSEWGAIGVATVALLGGTGVVYQVKNLK